MSIPEITNEWIDEYNQKRITCKTEGCDNPPAQKLGPYGGLCTQHREERKAAKNGIGPKVVRPIKRPDPTLVELAADIEETQARLAILTEKLRAKVDAL